MRDRAPRPAGETRPERPREQQAFINLLRAHDRLLAGLNRVLRASGISEPQFNVLRILRRAGEGGLPCGAIGERMITRVPDVTRLLDRLEHRGLVRRDRGAGDRRIVRVQIRDPGRELLASLDRPVLALHRRQFAHLEPRELDELNRLLAKVWSGAELVDDG